MLVGLRSHCFAALALTIAACSNHDGAAKRSEAAPASIAPPRDGVQRSAPADERPSRPQAGATPTTAPIVPVAPAAVAPIQLPPAAASGAAATPIKTRAELVRRIEVAAKARDFEGLAALMDGEFYDVGDDDAPTRADAIARWRAQPQIVDRLVKRIAEPCAAYGEDDSAWVCPSSLARAEEFGNAERVMLSRDEATGTWHWVGFVSEPQAGGTAATPSAAPSVRGPDDGPAPGNCAGACELMRSCGEGSATGKSPAELQADCAKDCQLAVGRAWDSYDCWGRQRSCEARQQCSVGDDAID